MNTATKTVRSLRVQEQLDHANRTLARVRFKDSADKQAAPVPIAGAESLASVNIVRGAGRGGREYHMGRDPAVEVKNEDGVTTIHLTFADNTTEVKVCWAMSDLNAKLLSNRL